MLPLALSTDRQNVRRFCIVHGEDRAHAAMHGPKHTERHDPLVASAWLIEASKPVDNPDIWHGIDIFGSPRHGSPPYVLDAKSDRLVAAEQSNISLFFSIFTLDRKQARDTSAKGRVA